MQSKFDVFNSSYSYNIFKQRYAFSETETWRQLCERVVTNVCGSYLSQKDQDIIIDYMYQRKFIPAGRYLYAAGREFHMVKNCYAFRADDTREGWADLLSKITITSMTGGGCGTDYSNLREAGKLIKRTGGVSSGPMALIHAVNEAARYIRQGGSRRAALLASLIWSHPDINSFIHAKDVSEVLKIAKDIDPNFPMPLELTNISINYDTEFFRAIENKDHPQHKRAKEVWFENTKQACTTGEPGFAINNIKDAFSLRNPCGEFVSDSDSDSCNLGSIFISKFNDREDFTKCIKYATKFLVCGNLYSSYPSDKMREIAIKNNRIGLGLGGVHEWLIINGFKYEVTPELHKWLNVYEQESDESAYNIARDLGVNVPLSKRAIAPTGTISALSESTTGIEPLFCKAFKRLYYKEDKRVYEYVVDGTIKKLLDKGVKDVDKIQDAYDIDFKDRVKFQADLQQYVDQAISSTINLPKWGSEKNNDETLKEYSKMLLKYAKRLRGITIYPDESRSGQPLQRVSLEEALTQEGKVFEYKTDNCASGVCGV